MQTSPAPPPARTTRACVAPAVRLTPMPSSVALPSPAPIPSDFFITDGHIAPRPNGLCTDACTPTEWTTCYWDIACSRTDLNSWDKRGCNTGTKHVNCRSCSFAFNHGSDAAANAYAERFVVPCPENMLLASTPSPPSSVRKPTSKAHIVATLKANVADESAISSGSVGWLVLVLVLVGGAIAFAVKLFGRKEQRAVGGFPRPRNWPPTREVQMSVDDYAGTDGFNERPVATNVRVTPNRRTADYPQASRSPQAALSTGILDALGSDAAPPPNSARRANLIDGF